MSEGHATSSARGVGAAAPDFELPDQHGTATALRDLRAAGPVVVVFFPFAHTSVCTSELREVGAAQPEFEAAGARSVAISCDSMFGQRVFADAEGLTFPLLSDFWPHGATASAYGVFDDERGCARRATFVVAPDGRITWTVVNAIADARDLGDVFAALAAYPGRHHD